MRTKCLRADGLENLENAIGDVLHTRYFNHDVKTAKQINYAARSLLIPYLNLKWRGRRHGQASIPQALPPNTHTQTVTRSQDPIVDFGAKRYSTSFKKLSASAIP